MQMVMVAEVSACTGKVEITALSEIASRTGMGLIERWGQGARGVDYSQVTRSKHLWVASRRIQGSSDSELFRIKGRRAQEKESTISGRRRHHRKNAA